MSSSTFSSKDGGAHRTQVHCLVLFVLTFSLLFTVSAAAWKIYGPPPLAPHDGELPHDDDNYVAIHYEDTYHLDHLVLLQGALGTRDRLAAADVLFLGNSRVMFALHPEVLRPFFRSRGLRHYMLGFGYFEQNRFPAHILRKFHLRPRVIVVSPDNFFTDQVSNFGARLLGMSEFDREKELFENATRMAIGPWLHTVQPHLNEPNYGRRIPLYRARSDGAWLPPWWIYPKAGLPFVEAEQPGTVLPEDHLRAARRFKAVMDHRGTQLVLMFVPAPTASRRQAELLAEALGVPLIAPRLEKNETADTSHLSRECGASYSALFVRDLDRLLR